MLQINKILEHKIEKIFILQFKHFCFGAQNNHLNGGDGAQNEHPQHMLRKLISN